MNQEAKILALIGVVTVVIVGVALFLLMKSNPSSSVPDVVTDTKLLENTKRYEIATPSASVTVVEFGDYQCPACGAAYPETKQMLQDYSGKINFLFRNFPLPQHPYAQLGAEAAEAAGNQGKFWQMHDMLYENQTTWGNLEPGKAIPQDQVVSTFLGYAQSLGLDVNKFKTDLQNNQYQDLINKDIADGNSLGINSTPTFFVNGQRVVGAPSYDELKSIINSKLPKK